MNESIEDDRKMEILLMMDKSLLQAHRLVKEYDFANDIRSSVVFMMKLWKDFYGTEHPKAKEYGL